jgi:hypothetical protein
MVKSSIFSKSKWKPLSPDVAGEAPTTAREARAPR